VEPKSAGREESTRFSSKTNGRRAAFSSGQKIEQSGLLREKFQIKERNAWANRKGGGEPAKKVIPGRVSDAAKFC